MGSCARRALTGEVCLETARARERVCERLRERELPLGAVVKLNGDCRSATRERDLGRF